MSIQLALASKEFEIIGLTTVYGNVDVETTTINALHLLHLANRPEIPVAKGAAKPLYRPFGGGVPFVHGQDGQGNTWQPISPLQAIGMAAEDFMIDRIKNAPNEIVIAALGPLTNLARALQKAPEIQHLVKEIVCMGGNAFCTGNATPAAEANILSDPEAADLVLGADWPVTMVGLDVTHKILLRSEDLREISTVNTLLNRHVSAAYVFYLDFFGKTNNIDGTYIHDASVFVYLLHKEWFTTIKYPVRVETEDCISLGKTWPSTGTSDDEEGVALRPWKNRPKVTICTDVQSRKVVQFIKKCLIKGC